VIAVSVYIYVYNDEGMRSGVVLDRVAVEILEKNAVAPSLLYLGDLVGRLFAHIFRIHSLWHTHHLEGVCLHEECKGVSADFFAS
jgi:hypothetical protein